MFWRNVVEEIKIHFVFMKLFFFSENATVNEIHSFIHQYSALEAGLAGTRALSCDRYGSGILHPGQVLGVVCHCFPPPLDVPTFAARCRYVRNDDPSSERRNCGREIVR